MQVCDLKEERILNTDICLDIIRPSTETWEFRRKGKDEFELKGRKVEATIKENHGYSGKYIHANSIATKIVTI